MKTETAVQWLNSELERLSNQIGVNLSWAIVDDLIKTAKEKEKQQIIEAFDEGLRNWDSELEAEQYYKQTFKD